MVKLQDNLKYPQNRLHVVKSSKFVKMDNLQKYAGQDDDPCKLL